MFVFARENVMLPRIYRNKIDFYTKKRMRSFLNTKKAIKRKIPTISDKQFNGFIEYLINNKYLNNHYKVHNGVAYLRIPKSFSFSSNPTETLETIKMLVGMYTNPKVDTIYIDHNDCNELDLGASLLMDAIIFEIDFRRKLIKSPISFKGQFKHTHGNIENESVVELLICSGVLKHLGVYGDKPLPPEVQILDFYDQYIKRHKNINHADAGQKVADYFNRCYESCNFQISEKGRNKLTDLVSEIVLNCENHSGKSKRWFCQGHFHMLPNRRNDGRLGVCQLSIISIGNTFYQSIVKCGTTYINKKLNKQFKLVTDEWKNLNGILASEKKKELYFMLYCLQENISRLKDEEGEQDRGKGTKTLFLNFQDLGKTLEGEKPILSITSGNCNIVFDGTYRMIGDDNSPKIIAFNEDNDLCKEPDERYVRNIESFFPGVIINLKFYIDEKYIIDLISDL